MDAIESLDVGAYAHFRFQFGDQAGFQRCAQIAYHLSDYLTVSVLFSLAAFLFLWQGKRRSAQVAAISLAIAFAVLFGVRFLVPRRRPDDAENWLGPQNMTGSYPSAGVFLFMLAVIFLGFATWHLIRPWLRILYIVTAAALTIWVSMSQLILAIHYVTDVLGAMAAAGLISWVAYRFLDCELPMADTSTTIAPTDAIGDLSDVPAIHPQ